MGRHLQRVTTAVGLVLLCSCGARSDLDLGTEADSPRIDAGRRDAGRRDAGRMDAGRRDAGGPGCVCTEPRLLAAGQVTPTSIAIDDTHVYWAVSGSGCDDGSIRRMPKCGGPIEELAAGEPNPRVVVLDDDNVYYYDACGSGVLRSVPRGGGPARDYAIMVGESGDALAEGGTDLYFSDYGLLRIPKAGGAQVEVDIVDFVKALAADDRGAYWTGLTGGTPPYAVRSYRPGDAEPTVLASPDYVGNAIAIDDDWIYFSASRGIARIPRDGGDVTPVVAEGQSWRIATDDRFVYWTDGFAMSLGYTINKAPKSGGGPTTVLGSGDGAYVDLAVDESCVYYANMYGREIGSVPK